MDSGSILVELYALFIRCWNLDDPKSNTIIKNFLKIIIPRIDKNTLEKASKKFQNNFLEWRHVLWVQVANTHKILKERAQI